MDVALHWEVSSGLKNRVAGDLGVIALCCSMHVVSLGIKLHVYFAGSMALAWGLLSPRKELSLIFFILDVIVYSLLINQVDITEFKNWKLSL